MDTCRSVADTLERRLQGIDDRDNGVISLHGPELAEWMHFVYPSECTYARSFGRAHDITPDVFDYWVLRCCRIVTSLGYQTVCEPEGEGAIFEREIACVLGHWQLRR